MSAENVQLATRFIDEMPLDDLARAFEDPARVAAMGATLEPMIAAELEVVAVGPEYTGEGTVYRGLAGFQAFWADWLEPYASLRIETDEVLDAGDRVVQVSRQIGRLRAADAVVDQPSAAVISFRDGLMTRIEFHLDRDRAMKSAGLAD